MTGSWYASSASDGRPDFAAEAYRHVSKEKLHLKNFAKRRAGEKLELAAKIVDSTSQSIFVTNCDGTILDVNPAYCNALMCSPDELIGQKCWDIKYGRHGKQFNSTIRRSLDRYGQWQGEFWQKRKNGELFSQWVAISALKDAGGATYGYVGVGCDITTMKEVTKDLERIAYYDPVTGLPNRILFLDYLKQILARCARNRGRAGLLFLDLDRFKQINDSFGHFVGDKLLSRVAKRLESCVRESDIVARLGGDEFTIILPDLADSRSVAFMAHRLVTSMARPFYIESLSIFVTASIGIALYPDDGTSAKLLLKNADQAMYHAKQAGKNRYQYFSEEVNAVATARMKLETAMRSALREGGFILQYQPQIHIPTNRVIGCEALIRWNRPKHGQMMPADFIPLADETGMISSIDKWVVTETCRQIRAWQTSANHDVPVSVHISERLLRRGDTIDFMAAVLDQTRIDPNLLELEVTERSLMQEAKASLYTLWRLKEMGFRLAIDDFGVGYSSLSQLKRLPVDRLKITRSFFSDFTSSPDNRAIVKAIIATANSLQVKVIAEGVETEEHVDFLRNHGCDEAQGYYYFLPLSAGDLIDRIARERDRVVRGKSGAFWTEVG